jgi:glycerol-3-phosphate dehydrogenase (NAD(P)+)
MIDFGSVRKIAVIGIGSWGTAVANEFSRNGYDTIIFTHEDDVANTVNDKQENHKYLSGFDLSKNLKATTENSKLDGRDVIVNCIPTQYISPYYSDQQISLDGKYIVNGSKGVENGSLRLISSIFKEEFGVDESHYAHLAGPSHAELLLNKDLTTVVCSSHNDDLSEFIMNALSGNYMRVYHSADVTGAEIGGAMKNVIALAAGILDGFNYGENAKAALITRGLAEISRLGVAMGANPLTFQGLTGIGDLIVTCMSQHSRNWQFGNRLAKGQKVEQIKNEMLMVAEGVATSRSAIGLAEKYEVEMPICHNVHRIIFGGEQPKEVIMDGIRDLMSRNTTSEMW